MFKTNFYNGEMSMNDQYISEAEATQNAGFGQYVAQQQTFPPTYGLGGNVYQSGPPQTQMYPNPFMSQPQQGFSYGNRPPGFSYGNRPNFGVYGNNNGYGRFYEQKEEIPDMVYIPPLAPSGSEYMLPSNFDDEIVPELILRYTKEEAEFKGKQIAEEVARSRMSHDMYSYNGNQFNYFGAPNYAPLYTQQFRSTIVDDLEKIKASAREARRNFDIHIEKLRHHYLNDGVTDEEIEEMFTGKYVPAEKNVYTNCRRQNMVQEQLMNLVPYDPTEPYRLAELETQRKIQSILPPDTTLEEFGSRAAMLYSTWELEEMYERRRSFRNDYDPITYRRLLREKIAEKEANRRGFTLMRSEEPDPITKIKEQLTDIQSTRSEDMSNEEKTQIMKSALKNLGMPLLSDCVSFDEDGHMVVKANIGNAKGFEYVSDENESYYANKRAMFAGFLDSIPRSEELHDEKIQQYNDYANWQNEEFKWNQMHPKPSIRDDDGGG